MKRIVMCKGTWPENGYEDFEVFEVKENETDQTAIDRAIAAYSEEESFYIKEVQQ